MSPLLPSELEMVGRLAMAALLGGLIGLEREMHSKPAGLRTYMVVCLGACLITLVSIYFWHQEPRTSDPSRVAAQIVSGIGFLGAGAILRYGMSVRGLTTAASLWTSAGIGMAVGAGYWYAAIAATGFTLVAVFIFDKVEKMFIGGRAYRRFVVHAKDTPGLVGRVEILMEKAEIAIKEVDIQRDVVAKLLHVTILATCEQKKDVDELSRQISQLPEVQKVEIE